MPEKKDHPRIVGPAVTNAVFSLFGVYQHLLGQSSHIKCHSSILPGSLRYDTFRSDQVDFFGSGDTPCSSCCPGRTKAYESSPPILLAVGGA